MKQCFIDVASIEVLDDGRRHIDEAAVERYAAALRKGATLAPIVVLAGADLPHRDADPARYYPLDGVHRVTAARRVGLQEIDAVVVSWHEYWPAMYLRGFIILPEGRPRA